MKQDNQLNSSVSRRSFIGSTAAVSAAGMLWSPAMVAHAKSKGGSKDDLKVAVVGYGAEGEVLVSACTTMQKTHKIGVRFVAVCDIWPRNLKKGSSLLSRYKRYGHEGHPYTDIDDMLATEKDLDAVIVATPDFWHARHTINCLERGLHVYCEKEMATTTQDAKEMVLAARKAGKLLQIGHQRRSNPRYRYCHDKIIKEAGLLGRMTTINGQWNRSRVACIDLDWVSKDEIDQTVLTKYGFDSMHQFRNWRWYKGKGGGPIVDLGSHQIDIFSWFTDSTPTSVMASGSTDYWTDHELYDSVIAVFEFATKKGRVRASYQTITTNSSDGYFEKFMGDEGTLVISEPDVRGKLYRESAVDAEKWEKWVKNGTIIDVAREEAKEREAAGLEDVRASIPAAEYGLTTKLGKVPYHFPHLENFFESIRGNATLNCPGEVGYESAVMVLKVNEAIAAGKKLNFTKEDFHV